MRFTDVAFAWDQASLFFRLQRGKVGTGAIHPRHPLLIDTPSLAIKTIDHISELEMAFKLRYEVFYRELLSKKARWGWDLDRFDFRCDHLIIIHKPSAQVIGTYRIISPEKREDYYSSTEFDLGKIPDLPGKKLELGRACIHPDFRSGAVISMLWRGISAYAQVSGARYLLGCSSVKTLDPLQIESICQAFKDQGVCRSDLGVEPWPAFRREITLQSSLFPHEVDAQADALIPPLLRGYIKAGARVCPEPAVDMDFQCVDFVTVLDLENMAESFRRKYFRERLE